MKSSARRYTLQGIVIGLVAGLGLAFVATQATLPDVNNTMIRSAEELIGLEFTPVERDSMTSMLESNREAYQSLRNLDIANSVPSSLIFDPVPPGRSIQKQQQKNDWDIPEDVELPEDRADLAFYTVEELASLIQREKITSVELTRFFLERLRKYGDTLEAVITYTEERALERARQMDRELQNGKYRGPLHGVPYGIKDLFALEGYKTTWGATPYKDQTIDQNATVVKKLDEAGAVLVAKLTLGALAYGDIWFGGKTRNPWKLSEGSSGSSAGSAAATSAGLVPFAIGTETLGSIVSPSTRCGTTGLRPTFGRVSRHGAMALSWSMDKIGPITRSVKDAALVFDAIQGPDGFDRSVKDFPFNYRGTADLSELRIGYFKQAFEQDSADMNRNNQALDKLRELGAELIPVELPNFGTGAQSIMLFAEAAAAFDELTRSNRDTLMKWQEQAAWPNSFRASRFIPAVEYINASRARTVLMEKMAGLMDSVDVYVSPPFGGNNLLITNLTGHPSVVLPHGFEEDGTPTSITFTGRLYDEGTLLSVAQAYQQATDFHKQHPPLFVN